MVGKTLLIMAIFTASLPAALGSGPFIRAGVGLNGLSGADLYIIPQENRYREIPMDSLMVYYKNFASNGAVYRPTLFVGWEQSFNLALSICSGFGLAFSGASWKEMPTYNERNEAVPVPDIDAVLNLIYVTIPLDAKLMLPINTGGFSCSFGPRVSFLTYAQFENRTRSYTSNEYSRFRPVSFGFGGSIGGEIRLRKMDLLMALRLDGGLTNASRDESPHSSYATLSLETGLRRTTKQSVRPSWWRL